MKRLLASFSNTIHHQLEGTENLCEMVHFLNIITGRSVSDKELNGKRKTNNAIIPSYITLTRDVLNRIVSQGPLELPMNPHP